MLITVFLLLCILFIPFTFHFFPYQQQITDFIFGALISFTGKLLFGISLKSTVVHSDSATMYLLVLLLFIFSLIVSGVCRFGFANTGGKKFISLVYGLCTFYLSLVLLKYGLDKVFKSQFYIPEPNTLYSRLGQLDKDILFWSSMGTSRLYNIITGSIEVLAAVLLFFRRTRLAGILLSVIILVQVVVINFSFDISVKVFSLFLLSISLYLFGPYAQRACIFLFSGKNGMPAQQATGVTVKNVFLKTFLKSLLAGLILLEGFYLCFRDRNFNDDTIARPLLHGAYTVESVVQNNDTLQQQAFPFKQFFIHRNGYFIFQLSDDKMQDYHLAYDTANQLLLLEDYQKNRTAVSYYYNPADSILEIAYSSAGKNFVIAAKARNWRNLPLLNDSFHWFAE